MFTHKITQIAILLILAINVKASNPINDRTCGGIKAGFKSESCCGGALSTQKIEARNETTNVGVIIKTVIKDQTTSGQVGGGIALAFKTNMYPLGASLVSFNTNEDDCEAELCPAQGMSMYSFPSIQVLKGWYGTFFNTTATPDDTIKYAYCKAWTFKSFDFYGDGVGTAEFKTWWESGAPRWAANCPDSPGFTPKAVIYHGKATDNTVIGPF